jgi:hypothetical protein
MSYESRHYKWPSTGWTGCAVFSFDGSTKQTQIIRVTFKLTDDINENVRMSHYDDLYDQ